MENLDSQPYELLAKHLSRESTPAEEEALAAWLQENPENQRVLAEVQAVWQAAEPANAFSPAVNPAWEKVSARLNLYPENAATVPTPEAKVIPLFSVRTVMRVAAVLLPLLVFGYLVYTFRFANPAETVVSAGAGKKDFYLPDSTHIWLKPNSTLSYTEDYNNEQREVKLSGEAFFEVQKNPQKPFVVQTALARVTVLGTSFLVKTSGGNFSDEVEVVTGKVAVEARQQTTEKVVLLPGDKAMVNQNATITQTKASNPNALAWKTEQLTFANAPLPEIAGALEDYFGVKVALDNTNLANCRFTGTFTKPELIEVLQVLSAATGLQYTNQNTTYRLSGEGCNIP